QAIERLGRTHGFSLPREKRLKQLICRASWPDAHWKIRRRRCGMDEFSPAIIEVVRNNPDMIEFGYVGAGSVRAEEESCRRKWRERTRRFKTRRVSSTSRRTC